MSVGKSSHVEYVPGIAELNHPKIIGVDLSDYSSCQGAGRSEGQGCATTHSEWRRFAQEGIGNDQRVSSIATEDYGGLHENFASGVTFFRALLCAIA